MITAEQLKVLEENETYYNNLATKIKVNCVDTEADAIAEQLLERTKVISTYNNLHSYCACTTSFLMLGMYSTNKNLLNQAKSYFEYAIVLNYMAEYAARSYDVDGHNPPDFLKILSNIIDAYKRCNESYFNLDRLTHFQQAAKENLGKTQAQHSAACTT